MHYCHNCHKWAKLGLYFCNPCMVYWYHYRKIPVNAYPTPIRENSNANRASYRMQIRILNPASLGITERDGSEQPRPSRRAIS